METPYTNDRPASFITISTRYSDVYDKHEILAKWIESQAMSFLQLRDELKPMIGAPKVGATCEDALASQ